MIPAANCHRCQRHRWQFAIGINDTGFASVVNTGGNLPLALLTPVTNLPPALLIPVVHLDLQISPRIFEKIRNGLNGLLLGWGETDFKKNQTQKIL
jgi:hypothetical protein